MDTVFSCVMQYVHDTADRNSVSLVSRQWYELDRLTRQHVTLHFSYATSPVRLYQRFPHLESLTVKGKPKPPLSKSVQVDWGDYATRWVKQIVTSFRCLKSVRFKRMIVKDSDLELLATKRGKQLTVLKIEECSGFTTYGLLHIGKYCNNLKTFSLRKSSIGDANDGRWLHELALRNRVIESLDFCTKGFEDFDNKDLVLIAKNCSKSLVSMRMEKCDFVDADVDFFSHAVNLEDFVGDILLDKKSEKHVVFGFPLKLRSVAMNYMRKCDIPFMLQVAHQLTKLDLLAAYFDSTDHCSLIERCPNLKVLYTKDLIGDEGLQCLASNCKKLRKIIINRGAIYNPKPVTRIGLTALAQGCLELECLHLNVIDITNEVLECIGTHLKNLYDFRLNFIDELDLITDLPLDKGVRALVKGCTKLKRLSLHISWYGGLTDVGLGYIGEYGHNLRYMFLDLTEETEITDAGLVKLSKGCPNLKKMEIKGREFSKFSEQALATFVLNVTSLRYLWVELYSASETDGDLLTIARPFWYMKLIKSKQEEQPSLLAYY